jgi:hypothetical protein
MARLFLRLAGFAGLAFAFALFVKDATRSIAGGELLLTPFGLDCATLFPTRFAQLQPLIERHLHPLLWDPVMLALLYLPTWAVLAAASALLSYAARPRPVPIGVAGRG